MERSDVHVPPRWLPAPRVQLAGVVLLRAGGRRPHGRVAVPAVLLPLWCRRRDSFVCLRLSVTGAADRRRVRRGLRRVDGLRFLLAQYASLRLSAAYAGEGEVDGRCARGTG